MFYGSVNVEEVISAMKELGGEANWDEIKEVVIRNRGDRLPPTYLHWDSYVKTIFQLIQQHCTGYSKFRGPTYFKKSGKNGFDSLIRRVLLISMVILA